MYFVYILQSLKDGDWYIGFTEDVVRRLSDHNSGKNISTAHRKPFKLMYYEAYVDKNDALGREKFLKSGAGHGYIKKQLKHYFNKEDIGDDKSR